MSEPRKQEYPTIKPLRYRHDEPGFSTGMFTNLEHPMMAKPSSKDRIQGSASGKGSHDGSHDGSAEAASSNLMMRRLRQEFESTRE